MKGRVGNASFYKDFAAPRRHMGVEQSSRDGSIGVGWHLGRNVLKKYKRRGQDDTAVMRRNKNAAEFGVFCGGPRGKRATEKRRRHKAQGKGTGCKLQGSYHRTGLQLSLIRYKEGDTSER